MVESKVARNLLMDYAGTRDLGYHDELSFDKKLLFPNFICLEDCLGEHNYTYFLVYHPCTNSSLTSFVCTAAGPESVYVPTAFETTQSPDMGG